MTSPSPTDERTRRRRGTAPVPQSLTKNPSTTARPIPGPRPNSWCPKMVNGARVTASKVAGILGLSPWDSPLRTWHVMAGNLHRPTTATTPTPRPAATT